MERIGQSCNFDDVVTIPAKQAQAILCHDQNVFLSVRCCTTARVKYSRPDSTRVRWPL